jgi:hypothetical protein
VATRLRGVRRFCRWLVVEGEVDKAPTEGIEIATSPDKPVPILTAAEITALLTTCVVDGGRPGTCASHRPSPPAETATGNKRPNIAVTARHEPKPTTGPHARSAARVLLLPHSVLQMSPAEVILQVVVDGVAQAAERSQVVRVALPSPEEGVNAAHAALLPQDGVVQLRLHQFGSLAAEPNAVAPAVALLVGDPVAGRAAHEDFRGGHEHHGSGPALGLAVGRGCLDRHLVADGEGSEPDGRQSILGAQGGSVVLGTAPPDDGDRIPSLAA